MTIFISSMSRTSNSISLQKFVGLISTVRFKLFKTDGVYSEKWFRGISKIFRVQDKVFSSGINSQCIQRAKLIADYIICSCHVKKWLEIGASSSQRENLRDRHFSWSAENETLLLIGSLSDRTLHPYLCFIRLFFIGQKSCNRGT